MQGRTGVWLDNRRKICAIGVRVAGGVTTHGFALNVTTDLRWFDYLIPCGLPDAVPASLFEELGHRTPAMDEVKSAVTASFARVFGYKLAQGHPSDLLSFVSSSPSPFAETCPSSGRWALGGEVLVPAGTQ